MVWYRRVPELVRGVAGVRPVVALLLGVACSMMRRVSRERLREGVVGAARTSWPADAHEEPRARHHPIQPSTRVAHMAGTEGGRHGMQTEQSEGEPNSPDWG